MQTPTPDRVLVALRRIFRAVDLHSKRLISEYGLTVPQLIVLRETQALEAPTVGELARAVSLSQATVTNIVTRLESRGLLIRQRSEVDKRQVRVSVTDEGTAVLSRAPSLLHDRFVKQFNELKDWEQSQLLASLQRLAELMNAEDLDASPVLVGPAQVDDPGGNGNPENT